MATKNQALLVQSVDFFFNQKEDYLANPREGNFQLSNMKEDLNQLFFMDSPDPFSQRDLKGAGDDWLDHGVGELTPEELEFGEELLMPNLGNLKHSGNDLQDHDLLLASLSDPTQPKLTFEDRDTISSQPVGSRGYNVTSSNPCLRKNSGLKVKTEKKRKISSEKGVSQKSQKKTKHMTSSNPASPPQEKRKRGRPRKNPQPVDSFSKKPGHLKIQTQDSFDYGSFSDPQTPTSFLDESAPLSPGKLKQTSTFRGVSCCGKDRKWQARIRDSNRVRYLGRYQTQVEAALVYDEAARKCKGEKASTNFVKMDNETLQKLKSIFAETGKIPEDMLHLVARGRGGKKKSKKKRDVDIPETPMNSQIHKKEPVASPKPVNSSKIMDKCVTPMKPRPEISTACSQSKKMTGVKGLNNTLCLSPVMV